MSLHFWFCPQHLSRMVLSRIRENHLCSWFTAKSRFLEVRECYFALLILSKWEFREEHVQTIKCLLHSVLKNTLAIANVVAAGCTVGYKNNNFISICIFFCQSFLIKGWKRFYQVRQLHSKIILILNVSHVVALLFSEKIIFGRRIWRDSTVFLILSQHRHKFEDHIAISKTFLRHETFSQEERNKSVSIFRVVFELPFVKPDDSKYNISCYVIKQVFSYL